jgi:hypothetical protein
MPPLRQRMLEEVQRRNYSSKIIRFYLRHVTGFAQYFRRSPDQLGAEEIRQVSGGPAYYGPDAPASSPSPLRGPGWKALPRSAVLNPCGNNSFCPRCCLSRKVSRALERAFKKHTLTLAGQLTPEQSPTELAALLRAAAHRNLVVYTKRPFTGPFFASSGFASVTEEADEPISCARTSLAPKYGIRPHRFAHPRIRRHHCSSSLCPSPNPTYTVGHAQVLTYLSRYTHRISIANSRLVAMADGRGSLRYIPTTNAHYERAFYL